MDAVVCGGRAAGPDHPRLRFRLLARHGRGCGPGRRYRLAAGADVRAGSAPGATGPAFRHRGNAWRLLADAAEIAARDAGDAGLLQLASVIPRMPRQRARTSTVASRMSSCFPSG